MVLFLKKQEVKRGNRLDIQLQNYVHSIVNR